MVVYSRVRIEYNHMNAVIDTLFPQADNAVKSYCDSAQAFARSIVPVRTGHLKESITVAATGLLEYEVFTDVEYARFVEWGTRFMRAQPFMTPAAQAALLDLPSIGNRFGGALDTAAISGRIQR